MAINVRNVTEVDKRVAKRLGMDPEKVNLVINVWAEEYLRVERLNSELSEAANQTTVVKPARAPKPRAASKPRKPAAKQTATAAPEIPDGTAPAPTEAPRVTSQEA
jgi:hypothetical protein